MSESQIIRTRVMEHQFDHIAFGLADIERGSRSLVDMYPANLATAFVFYLASRDGLLDIEDLKSFLGEKLPDDSQLRAFILERVGGKNWDKYRRLIRAYSEEDLKSYILHYSHSASKSISWPATPDSISTLALRLLNPTSAHELADLCCGAGSFMREAMTQCAPKSFTGIERSAEAVCIAKMRAIVLNKKNIEIRQDDVLEPASKEKLTFDRVFVDPPYNTPAEHMHVLTNNGEIRFAFFPPTFPSLRGRGAGDWAWILKALDMLKKNGKAVVLMPLGRLSLSGSETQNRRYLFEHGLVECAIALPGCLCDYTNIRLGLLVLSEGNKTVRLIDAKNEFKAEARRNVLTDENIQRIVEAKPKAGFCTEITLAVATEKDYSLAPESYLNVPPEVPNPVPLSSLLLDIGRGISLRREELHELSTAAQEDRPGPAFRLVSVSDIKDGAVCNTMTSLGTEMDKISRYVIEDGDVLLSKIPSPLKAAVAKVPADTVLVACVNLYILKVDKSKCDPYYLQAYLCSKLGRAQLSQATAGVAIQTITLEGLKKVLVPGLALERQKAFGEKYKQMLEVVQVAREAAEKTAQKAERAFDDEFVQKEDEQ